MFEDSDRHDNDSTVITIIEMRLSSLPVPYFLLVDWLEEEAEEYIVGLVVDGRAVGLSILIRRINEICY